MRLLLLLSVLFTLSAFAKDIKEFNHHLIQTVHKDVKNNNDMEFKERKAFRGPASVETEPHQMNIKEEKRFDKMNLRQFGHSKW